MLTATSVRSTLPVSLTATEGPEYGALGTVTVYGDSTVSLRVSCIRLPACLELRTNFNS